MLFRSFENKKIGLPNATPAQILQHLLKKKWKLKENDKDMIVMQHQFEYNSPRPIGHPSPNGEGKGVRLNKIISSLVVIGENQTYTAMAKTVGLPLGIAAKLILNNKIKTRGVRIPITQEIYEPVLKELENFGIKFFEE